jgi:hypothetical protein
MRCRKSHNMGRDVLVLWSDGDWRCEVHTGFGSARLEVYNAGQLVTAEATVAGRMATYRAEILRQRVLRGDLRARADASHIDAPR